MSPSLTEPGRGVLGLAPAMGSGEGGKGRQESGCGQLQQLEAVGCAVAGGPPG